MNPIEQLISNAKDLNAKLSDGIIIQSIIRDNDAFIIGMNVDAQLYKVGVDRNNVEIMDYKPYKELTIQIKREKGQPTDRVTLRDTGDFHRSFYLEVGGDQFEIKASDEKTASLVKKYGRQIFGLTDQNLTELIWEYIYPDLLNITKQEIYGN